MNRNLIVTLDAQKSNFVHKCLALESSGLATDMLSSNSMLCQFLFNLINEEADILNQIEKTISNPKELKNVGFRSSIKLFFGIGIKFKSHDYGRNTKTFEELTKEWTQIRMKLDEVDMLDDCILTKAIYHHSSFGAMHYGHVLILLHKNFNKFLSSVGTLLN